MGNHPGFEKGDRVGDRVGPCPTFGRLPLVVHVYFHVSSLVSFSSLDKNVVEIFEFHIEAAQMNLDGVLLATDKPKAYPRLITIHPVDLGMMLVAIDSEHLKEIFLLHLRIREIPNTDASRRRPELVELADSREGVLDHDPIIPGS